MPSFFPSIVFWEFRDGILSTTCIYTYILLNCCSRKYFQGFDVAKYPYTMRHSQITLS